MGSISLQMLDHHISSDWWKKIVKYFIQSGDILEIRCWKEELNEISRASRHGTAVEDHNEISIKGAVSEELIAELLSENPTDKSIYNKMTKYFTINTEHFQRRFCSAHYGTEMYIMDTTDDDVSFFQKVLGAYSTDDFSVSIDE